MARFNASGVGCDGVSNDHLEVELMARSDKMTKSVKYALRVERFRVALECKFTNIDEILKSILFPLFGKNNFNYINEQPDPFKKRLGLSDDISDVRKIGAFVLTGGELEVVDVSLKDVSSADVLPLFAAIADHCGAMLLICHDACHAWRLCWAQMDSPSNDEMTILSGTYICGPEEPAQMAAARLSQLTLKNKLSISDVANVFSLNKLKFDFYDGSQNIYNKFCDYVLANRSNHDLFDVSFVSFSQKDIRKYISILFARILFVFFIQRTKWLGQSENSSANQSGDPHFIQTLFDKAGIEQHNFLNIVLMPLFEALSDKRDGDLYNSHVDEIGCVKVPYFDLALFQHEENFKAIFPKDYFRELIDFFSNYNYYLDESDPNNAILGIDPSIFALIFEFSLENNSKFGVYYTPHHVVRSMCKASLVAYLQTGRNNDERAAICKFVRTHDIACLGKSKKFQKEMIKRLHSVKICDPAVGGGAYTMGFLHELESCLDVLEPETTRLERRKNIISENLYAVDIDAIAMDVAKIRFTMALAAVAQNAQSVLATKLNFNQGSALAAWNGLTQIPAKRRRIEPDYRIESPWQNEFDKILNHGGFDIVIANPPYGVKITPEDRAYYKKYYRWCESRCDIYMLFFEQGLRLTRNVLCFITPDKWLSKTFALHFREEAMLPYMRQIIRLGNAVFKTATVDAVISLFKKNKSDMLDILICDGHSFKRVRTIDKSLLLSPYIIDQFFVTKKPRLIELMEAQTHVLSEYVKCEYASANPADAYKLKEYIYSNSSPRTGEYKVINTGLVSKYTNRWDVKTMQYLKQKYDHPVVRATDLSKVFNGVFIKRMSSPKLIIKGLSLLDCTVDSEGKMISTVGTLNIRSNSLDLLYVLSALINSSVMTTYCKAKYFSGSYCGGLLFTPEMIGQLPVPELSDLSRYHEVISAVKHILYLQNGSDPKDELKHLDNLVAALYGLDKLQ